MIWISTISLLVLIVLYLRELSVNRYLRIELAIRQRGFLNEESKIPDDPLRSKMLDLRKRMNMDRIPLDGRVCYLRKVPSGMDKMFGFELQSDPTLAEEACVAIGRNYPSKQYRSWDDDFKSVDSKSTDPFLEGR